MKRMIRNRILLLFLCTFLIANNIVVVEVKAEGLTMTLGAVVSGAGGALSMLGPLLLGAAVIYAGYEIYQHREAIQSAFHSWYTSANDTVKSWLESKALDMEAGIITDGDTLIIPQDVLNQSAAFVKNFAVTYNNTKIVSMDSTVVYLNTLESYFSSQAIKDRLKYNTWYTSAPIVIYKNALFGTENVMVNMQQTDGKLHDTVIMEVKSQIILSSSSYQNWLMNGYSDLWHFGNITADQSGNSSVYNSIEGKTYMQGTALNVDGNKIYGNQIEITVIYPKNSKLVIATPEALVPGKTGQYNPSLCRVLQPTADALDNPLVKQNDYTYTPTYKEEGGVIGLPVILYPDKLQAIYDYVVKGNIKEKDMMRILDKDGVKEKDKTEGIIDVITDLPGAIGQAIQDAMEWLFVPDQAKVQEFVQEATEIVEGNSNLFTYPFELVVRFLNGVNQLGKTDCILIIPKIQFKDYVLYGGSQFNFTEFVKRSELILLYGHYIKLTNFVLIIAVINLAIKKGDEIIRGN